MCVHESDVDVDVDVDVPRALAAGRMKDGGGREPWRRRRRVTFFMEQGSVRRLPRTPTVMMVVLVRVCVRLKLERVGLDTAT